MAKISREAYVGLYGPTVGDKIRLGDTNLFVEIEKDLRASYGDEAVFGGGKTLRDGMGFDNTATSSSGCLDLVLTNATIIDPIQGVVKADIGIKAGKIVGIGKAGNPNTMEGVTPGLVCGPATDAINCGSTIVTAGGIDTHVHLICPQIDNTALAGGCTTLIAGGFGPTDGTNATTVTSGVWNVEQMLRSMEAMPLNIGLMGKGQAAAGQGAGKATLVEQIEAGVCSLKIHEDWGTTPNAIRACLRVADEYDVQVAIHTDTLNEGGYVEDSIAAFEGRTIHTFHTEGGGGGHAPDIIRTAGFMNVLPSSTNPSLPFGINTQAELFDMICVCHHLNAAIPADAAFAESRVRSETIAAENVLHDLGAISIFSSDSQAMGRIGENWQRCVQTAHFMKEARGKLPEDAADNDNFRVLRYVAKITINPAIAHGVAHVIGSVEAGKMADLVLWAPEFFGAKPKMIIKGGVINYTVMGDPNASLPTCQPLMYRRSFGALGGANGQTCATFVSKTSFNNGIKERYGLEKQVIAVENCRAISKADMVRNSYAPVIQVNPETFAVTIDGVHLTVPPAKECKLNQMYFFS
jgi:urease subunit alpha